MWGWVFGIFSVLIVIFVWGILHLRHSQKIAHEAIRKVRLEDVDRLRLECETVFKEKFSENLSLDDYDHSAKLLSDRLDNAQTLKDAFAKEDFYWYFVLPVGAYVGELLRVHAKGQWKSAEDGGLKVEILVSGEPAMTHPFDKVIKQATIGDKGDLYAYFKTAANLQVVVSGLPVSDS